jgi:nucleotide-binding universal stress UspA family protein
MYTHIILAYDGSEYAKRAAERAVEIAYSTGAKITVLTAYPSLSNISFLNMEISKEDMKNYWVERASEVKPLLEEKGIAYDFIVEEGEPRELILEKARELNADLIVVGSRGLNRYQRWMLGAISQGISTHAKCDVLIVK